MQTFTRNMLALLRPLSSVVPWRKPACSVAVVEDSLLVSIPIALTSSPSDAARTSSTGTALEIGSRDRRSANIERSWKAYFADPSRWWDNRKSKTYPSSPDFRHKITKESLWIDGWYNPSWVKDMLEKIEGMHTPSTSDGCDFIEDSFGAGVQRNASTKPQELQDNISWEMLSLEEALVSLERMPQPPSVEDIICILCRCRKKKDLVYAQRLHVYMCKSGLEAHRSLGNYLVPMLVEVGSMHAAQQVFNKLVDRNEYCWTSLIIGYNECGEPQHALNLYQKMRDDCVDPSEYTFVALLKACARLNDVERGQEIHAEIARKGAERDYSVGHTLVDMYAKCGLLAKAHEAFDKLLVRDLVSWNALITGYAKHGLGEAALKCFVQMKLEGIFPDAVTFVCILKACSSIGAADKGQEVHVVIITKGLLESDPFVGSTLVDMYAKCGLPAKAQEVFDELPVHDVVSWTALIAAYAEHDFGKKALDSFEQMQLEGISPNVITFVCSLKACGSIRDIEKGQEIHAKIGKTGLERDLVVCNTLVDMYGKCGSLEKALEVFEKLPVRDVVSWTALIAGYTEQGLGEEALNCFEQMQKEGISPNAVTFVCGLKACSIIGAINKGKELHLEITQKRLERDLVVGNTLVDMYAKCGSLIKAHEAFDGLAVQDVVSWNAIIAGYAHQGESEDVFQMLERMKREGMKPNGVTFLSVLTVCSHTGLVEMGQRYFEAMSKDYGITPTLVHHSCMVDILGRAGQLDEAVAMMKDMPFRPNLVVWHTLLGSCQKWGNVELGRHAFEHAVQFDEKNAAAYILMSNIYANTDMQEDEEL